jgi:predicted DNA-binding mobile mystery protein A
MITASEQLDKRLSKLASIAEMERPSRGWIRAVREALGMTTGQLAKRMKVHQPRISELEHNEVEGNITLKSLERAAAAMGCRVGYIFIPEKPLTETLRDRASEMADKHLASVDHTMKLESQGVNDRAQSKELHQMVVSKLLQRPARLWDEL